MCLLKQWGGNRVENKNKEYDINSDIQTLFTNTNAATKQLNNDDEMRVGKVLTDVGFYDYDRPKTKGNKSAMLKNVTDDVPKAIEKL